MAIATYLDGLREAYEGEIEGEAVYRHLSELKRGPSERNKLATIADVEHRTHRILHACASRLGLEPDTAAIATKALLRANELNRLEWPDLVAKALVDWPPYIERFVATERLAPDSDAWAVRRLVEHERALVDFIRLEHEGSPHSLAPLEEFLARTGAKPIREVTSGDICFTDLHGIPRN